MNDPRREGNESTRRLRQAYPPYTDPAYGGHSPYAPTQDPRAAPASPTAKLPQYWPQDQFASDPQAHQLPPDRRKTPRWLWVAAAASAVLVTGLVLALVFTGGSTTTQSSVPPLSAMPTPTGSASPSSQPSSTGSSTPSGTATAPPQSGAGAVDAVVYSVTGEGRAISISYRDSDDVTQTEFNVALPWSKEVKLPKSGGHAHVTIINIGHDITCTLTVAGQQVRQHTGAGLTICDAPA